MSDPNIDLFNLTGNESPEELEALLEGMDDMNVVDELQTDPGLTEDVTVQGDQNSGTPEADTNNADAATAGDESTTDEGGQVDAGTQDDITQDEDPVVMSKDGKHTIPYAVLEASRNEGKFLKQRIAELEQGQSEIERERKLLEIRNQQLEEYGIKPADLPEELDMSGDALAELKENYPELVPYITALNAKLEKFTAAAPAQAPQGNSVHEALAANANLTAWSEADDDRWQVALDIDDKLIADPAWRSKTHSERLAEVERRTLQIFSKAKGKDAAPQPNSQAQAKAQAAKEQAEATLPNSPSELGATNKDHPTSLIERAAGMNSEDLAGLFETMDPDDVEALLAEIEF